MKIALAMTANDKNLMAAIVTEQLPSFYTGRVTKDGKLTLKVWVKNAWRNTAILAKCQELGMLPDEENNLSIYVNSPEEFDGVREPLRKLFSE